MGAWLWTITLGLFLVLMGLYIHWSVVLAGALLPFVPVVAELLRRRRARAARSADEHPAAE
jgi:hypothetical protein